MKTTIIFILVALLNCSLYAQSSNNYRSRNYKLNRNYKKEINSKKHRFANYKSGDRNDEMERVSKFPRSEKTRQLTVRNSSPSKKVVENSTLTDQKTTITGARRKNGKRLLNFFAMVVALSLIIGTD